MIVSRAPFRISLGGGGSDLPSYYEQHGGFILSAAIDKYISVALSRNAVDNKIRVRYSKHEEVDRIHEIEHDLVRNTLPEFGITKNIEITSISEVPSGTGLGSSGTFLVALLKALHEINHNKVNKYELAEQACHIEMNLANHSVGKHDHYLASFGGFTFLEIEKSGKVQAGYLNIDPITIEQFRKKILLFYTGNNRSSRDILQTQKNESTAQNSEMIDSLHKTVELGRTIKTTLEQGDIDEFGFLLDRHWENKKRRSSDISNSNIDKWYNIAKKNGANGGKIMGAGGGGFFMFCCPDERLRYGLRSSLYKEGLVEMCYNFDFNGAQTIGKF